MPVHPAALVTVAVNLLGVRGPCRYQSLIAGVLGHRPRREKRSTS